MCARFNELRVAASASLEVWRSRGRLTARQKMRVPEAVIVGLAVILAVGAALGGVAVLIRSPIQSEAAFLLVATTVIVVPALVVVWALRRGRQRSPTLPGAEPPISASPWLEVWDDEERGYTVVGDARALELLGAECLRLAADDGMKSSDHAADIEIDGVTVKVVRRDIRPVSEPQTWKDKLVGVGCLVVALLLGAIWLRGCVAIESDVERWLK